MVFAQLSFTFVSRIFFSFFLIRKQDYLSYLRASSRFSRKLFFHINSVKSLFMANSWHNYQPTKIVIFAAFYGDRDIKMGDLSYYFEKNFFCTLLAFFMSNIVENTFFK